MKQRFYSVFSCIVTAACGGVVTGTDPSANSGSGGRVQIVGTGGSPAPGSSGAPTIGSGGTTGIGSGGSSAGGSTSVCLNTQAEAIDPGGMFNPWITAIFAFGDAASAPITAMDPASTFCLDSPAPGVICLDGSTADAGTDYHRWGTGLGFALTTVDASGATVPLDATRAGIVAVRFTLQNQAPFGARAMLSLVDDPATVDLVEYDYAFFVGGVNTAPYVSPAFDGLEYTGSVTDETVRFDQFGKPVWDTTTFPFDPTKLNAFEFQVVSVQGASAPYRICLSDVAFLDSNGNVVEP